MLQQTAVYPGSFDPITNGHIDIIRRASGIFREVVVSVLYNRNKTSLFSQVERMELIKEAVKPWPNVKVDSFAGLLVEYMRQNNLSVAIRGLRAVSDLEYEFQIAHTNRTLYPDMETVFLMPGENYVYLTSSTVKEVAALNGDVGAFVPPNVAQALRAKFSK